MRVCISTSSILFMAGVVFKLMFISLKWCESAHFLLSIRFLPALWVWSSAYACCWDSMSTAAPLMGCLFSCYPPSSSDITVWRVVLWPGLEIPCRLNSSLLYFSLMWAFVGFLCVLWFTALHYIQEEVGKETGSPLSRIIAAAPTHQIGELNLIWYW